MAVKGINTFLEYLAAQITTNSALSSFCLSQFGRAVSVCVGQQEEDLPDADESYPLVILVAASRGISSDNTLKEHQAIVSCVIKDARPKVTASRITTFPGNAVLDEFTDKVAQAIASARAPSGETGYYFHSFTSANPDLIAHPFFQSWLGLSVQLDAEL